MDVLDVLMNLFRLKCWIEADLHFLYFVSPRHWRPTTPSILVSETSAVYFSINYYSSHKIIQPFMICLPLFVVWHMFKSH